MSIKDVRDYHLRMTSDYLSLKETLDKLQSEITPETSKEALANIERIKQQVERVQENYNRVNYIIYLLDKPKRKRKQHAWEKQHKKALNAIPKKDKLEGIEKENKEIINDLNKYIDC